MLDRLGSLSRVWWESQGDANQACLQSMPYDLRDLLRWRPRFLGFFPRRDLRRKVVRGGRSLSIALASVATDDDVRSDERNDAEYRFRLFLTLFRNTPATRPYLLLTEQRKPRNCPARHLHV